LFFKWKTSSNGIAPVCVDCCLLKYAVECWWILPPLASHMHCIRVLNILSRCRFFFIFKHSLAPKGSWKIFHRVLESRGFFVSKRVEHATFAHFPQFAVWAMLHGLGCGNRDIPVCTSLRYSMIYGVIFKVHLL